MFKNFQQIEVFFEERKRLGIKPGLERINALLNLLHNPQKKMHAIHVAGTNGKGSTVHFIKNALMANGYQVGVFTSPSFTGLTGHIFINNSSMNEEEFLTLCNDAHPAIMQLDEEGDAPTEFEILTVLAFLYFSRNTNIALIETGMGGREDTTNCFQPILSIITNVSRDHTAFLGDTSAEIAYQKAGIIKNKAPVIIGDMDKEALHVMKEEAQIHETTLDQLGADFTPIETSIQMQGEHQIKNASIAYMALKKLREHGYSIDFKKAIAAISCTQIPGRFELVKRNPVMILDGAHNPAGIKVFLQTVAENYNDKEKHLLFAGFKDKELETMLKQFSNEFSSITLTSFDHPRAARADVLYEATNVLDKHAVTNWKDAIDMMLQNKKHAYFITGSLHFIAMVRKYLRE
ncbi:dihydrofolate synthase/folylpolyglutamate synthase [Virgibacillus natechei]|uniref:tetrahydrofolate synthase n=1 Tax=Virgibacillus natechei TaxID=1216297 RepID=A0ABS4ICY4_9BACI|nr:folylpolyglutamate synthase/dihydrofolate synthase family protein [Virgibacillus natechei]MBP1968804.1 dihydrofolate synthase/folylpolyglutamate synthase [Virgibacillus natechei]UZD11602.1 bifunctional folylpolyglutamate synthase/dihydrofolate synthase [Virgibacillus natechei]